MAEIIWLPIALDEVEEIHAYIAKDSQRQANRVVSKIFDVAAYLADSPRLGHVVPEWDNTDVREYPVLNRRVIYRVEQGGTIVRILTVIHGARLLPDEIREW